ncbi:MAG TPA: M20/M25/M40 family metallo-hydrolase [Gammaproteobacteria bacterium]|nr:M20/M25/M40 family metallo-hydrolase [Gammaproteobacteria bacterium]
MRRSILLPVLVATVAAARAQPPAEPSWPAVEAETLQHFQALVRMDTSDPPGNEKPAADYLQQVLEREGIAVETFAKEPHRPNVVARLKGSGAKRPLLIMGHLDVVNVDPAKWQHPPFGAVRDGGYIYGRGTVDDKDNVTAALMIMLLLKRAGVPLDRDVIFLAEAGEEGNTPMGIELMANEHFDKINAEYCLAEGGGVSRLGGTVRYASVETGEKIPNGIDLVAHGPSGHGSVPLQTNAIAHLARAVAAATEWQPAVRLNATTRAYFTRLADMSSPQIARVYRDVLSADPKAVAAADAWLRANEPRHASMLRTSLSPNIVNGGYRNNVIPSEARATLDVRMLPDQNPDEFRAELEKVVGDPAVEVVFNHWPPSTTGKPREGGLSRIDNEAFTVIEAAIGKHYATKTLPTMIPAATDMAFLRAKGVQCYGMGPATDEEDGPKGFGAHSDQERILEAELHRFVRFQWDVVQTLARAKASGG